MILAQIVPDLTDPTALRSLMDARVTHTAIAKSFSGERVLWRIDGANILVQADDLTDPVSLSESLPGDVLTVDLDPHLASLTDGEQVTFRSTVVAMKSLRREVPLRGEKVPLSREEDIRAWFDRQDIGLDVLGMSVRSLCKQSFRHGEEGVVTLAPHRIDGVARITDAEKVREAVVSGIGRARAYGCGLLSIGR